MGTPYSDSARARSRFSRGRTARHADYLESQRKRKREEESFSWMKTVGPTRKTRHRGQPKVSRVLTLTAAAYDSIRMRNAVRDPNGRTAVGREVGGMEGRSRIKRSIPPTRT